MKKYLFKTIIIFLFIIQLSTITLGDDISEETVDVSSEIEVSKNVSETPEINSRSCVVLDRNSKMILYGKNENNVVKMASTTKIMTATIVLEKASLDQTVEVSKKAAGTRRFSSRSKSR